MNFNVPDSKNVWRRRCRQFDSLIIDRNLGLTIAPSAVFYGPFLQHCILTNEAVETTWQPNATFLGSDKVLISFSLIVSRYSFSLWTWTHFQIGGKQPTLSDVISQVFWHTFLLPKMWVCLSLHVITPPLWGCWSLVSIRKIIYNF